MFIAFEGPDNVGKSTAAARLATGGEAIYNITKRDHEAMTRVVPPGDEDVITYDRIDWFSHMVYRLALPDRDWNDDRPRTVFAMPETHLVVKIHHPETQDFTADEVVDTPIARVNPMYWYFAEYFMQLNRTREYELFKSVSIIEVVNTDNKYEQRLRVFDNPNRLMHTIDETIELESDYHLLEFLRDEDAKA